MRAIIALKSNVERKNAMAFPLPEVALGISSSMPTYRYQSAVLVHATSGLLTRTKPLARRTLPRGEPGHFRHS
jgi:hypothetical protein